jgi:hypothetical protein
VKGEGGKQARLSKKMISILLLILAEARISKLHVYFDHQCLEIKKSSASTSEVIYAANARTRDMAHQREAVQSVQAFVSRCSKLMESAKHR